MFKEKLLKKALKLYVGDHVLKRVLELGEEAFQPRGVPQELTVMFIQVNSNNSADQAMSSAHATNSILNLITSSVLDHDGIVDSVIGIDVSAFWGFDRKAEHADQAARCATDILGRINSVLPSIKAHIGINTGTVLIGNTGSENRMKFTVLGDTVNLACGLTSVCASYPGVNILLTEFTQSHLSESFNLQNVGQISVKGRDKGVTLFSLH